MDCLRFVNIPKVKLQEKSNINNSKLSDIKIERNCRAVN